MFYKIMEILIIKLNRVVLKIKCRVLITKKSKVKFNLMRLHTIINFNLLNYRIFKNDKNII